MKLLIEGKAKKIFSTKDKSTLVQYFKDDATAFNNKKRKQFKSKGILNNSISALIFKYLNDVNDIGKFKVQIAKDKIKKINPNTKIKTDTAKEKNSISFRDANVWPFLFFAALISFCQASLLQSIGFYITDIFSDLPDLPLIISICFAILSISTIISQYLFTDLFGLDNAKLLKYGILIVLVSYLFAAYSSSIAIFYFAIILNGIGSGMIRPANASALSLAQSPENQGSAAGYLGSVIPIGHMLTPVVAMPIYQIDPTYLYIFSAILCFIAAIFIIINPTMKSVKLLENE